MDIYDIIRKLFPIASDIEYKSTNSKRTIYNVRMPDDQRLASVNGARNEIKFSNDIREIPVAKSRYLKSVAFCLNDDFHIHELRTKPDGKKSKRHIHELLTAACVFLPIDVLYNGNLNLILEKVKSIILSETIDIKNKDNIKLNDKNIDYDTILQAISAAISLKTILPSVPERVYITTDKWPDELNLFHNDSNHVEMKYYNPSDVIFECSGKFFGISIKKKKRKNDVDPPLVNKSFMSFIKTCIADSDIIEENLKNDKNEFFKRILNVRTRE